MTDESTTKNVNNAYDHNFFFYFARKRAYFLYKTKIYNGKICE